MKRIFLSVIIICLLLSLSPPAHAQASLPDQKITLSFENIYLGDLLQLLRSAYKINLSYSADNLPLGRPIDITAFNLSIRAFIDLLCTKAGLSYRLIGDQVVLREKNFAKKAPSNPPKDSLSTLKTWASGKRAQSRTGGTSFAPIAAYYAPDIPVRSTFMEHLDAVVVPLYKRHGLDVQRNRNLTIGLLTSYDLLRINFKERRNKDQKFFAERSFSGGIFGTIYSKQSLSVTIGLLFTSKSYYLDYNYKLNDPNDPFPLPQKTSVRLKYAEFPVTFNFPLLGASKLSLYFSPGLMADFLINKKEGTTFLGGKKKTTQFFVRNHKQFIWGGSFSLKLNYGFSNSVKVFFQPNYVYYFLPLNEEIMHSNTRLLGLKTGITVNFNL